MKSIAFFYTMKKKPDLIKELVPDHIQYWKDRGLANYKGGPFFDRSGGLITFLCDDFEFANKIINDDPFVKGQVIIDKQIKIWITN